MGVRSILCLILWQNRADMHEPGGKSAVLSAITVALGGKSASTGRGSGLKSFIKEGEKYVLSLLRLQFIVNLGHSAAEVTITLKNQGEEAFKPKEYGKSIMITRRFTKEGSSTWKIRNAAGHPISSKREELAAICDHMNIQVDNPMNVLTQGRSRLCCGMSSRVTPRIRCRQTVFKCKLSCR
jgi:chromosome segregation ATPase